jgi:hypothetical protein
MMLSLQRRDFASDAHLIRHKKLVGLLELDGE